jgi:hypothetical protein
MQIAMLGIPFDPALGGTQDPSTQKEVYDVQIAMLGIPFDAFHLLRVPRPKRRFMTCR